MQEAGERPFIEIQGSAALSEISPDVIVKASALQCTNGHHAERESRIDPRHHRANGMFNAEHRRLNLGLLKYCKWTQSFRVTVLFTLGGVR